MKHHQHNKSQQNHTSVTKVGVNLGRPLRLKLCKCGMIQFSRRNSFIFISDVYTPLNRAFRNHCLDPRGRLTAIITCMMPRTKCCKKSF